MADTRKSIELFLRRHLFGAREKPIYVLKLRCVGTGQKRGKPVDEFSISPDFSVDSLESLLDEIVHRAQTDADGRSGVVRYGLMAYEKANSEPVGSVAFRMRAEEAEWDESDGEEEASLSGVVKQQMRHTEALTRLVVQMSSATMGTMSRQIHDLHRENADLRRERTAMIQAHEASLSMQSERDIELLQASASEERKNKAFEKAMALAPIVVNKIAGQTVLKADDPLVMILRDLSESLDSKQIQAIASSLTSQQQISFLTVLKQVKQLPAASNGTAKE